MYHQNMKFEVKTRKPRVKKDAAAKKKLESAGAYAYSDGEHRLSVRMAKDDRIAVIVHVNEKQRTSTLINPVDNTTIGTLPVIDRIEIENRARALFNVRRRLDSLHESFTSVNLEELLNTKDVKVKDTKGR